MNSPAKEELPAMHIVELRSENVKRLRAITIRPDGRIITIGGDNDMGKSSVLESIEMGIGGADHIIEEPIRRGAKKARTVIDFGDIVVRRTFTKAGSTVVVEGKDGQPKRSPQELLNRLCSAVTFDPFGFTLLKPDKQAEILRGIVKLDFTALDAARQKAYDERTMVNRDLAQQKAVLANLPFHQDGPAEEESSVSVLAEIDRIHAHNQEVQNGNMAVSQTQETLRIEQCEMSDAESEVTRIEAVLLAAKGRVKEHATRVEEAAKACGVAKDHADAIRTIDVQPLKTKLAGLESANAKFRANRHYNETQKLISQKSFTSEALTTKIEDCEEKKQTLLEATKFPVPGLSFGENGVLLDGLPFDQAGDAEKIRVSVAIAAALNPTIRVMLIRDGSLIGTKKMELIRQLAEEYNLQVWIEVVTDSNDKKSSVVIEDGHRVGEVIDEEPPPEESAPVAEEQSTLEIPPSR